MALKVPTFMSSQEYLEFEEQSEERHEYIDGIIQKMPGELRLHNEIAINVISLLRQAARSQQCWLAVENIKLWIHHLNRYYYPDVMVSCDARDTDPKMCYHPCFIVEIFSPSTELTDRREKLQAYRTIETLQGYLMVDPDKKLVEYLERTPTDWTLSKLESGELSIACLQTTLKLQDIFA
jgi:Uma2 family endonuclease